MRPGEVDGESYRFVDEERFPHMRAAGRAQESARYNRFWYGTPRAWLEDRLAEGCAPS
jgi:guanylate kinase